MAVLLGFSIPQTLTDDAGNSLKGVTVAVTGPNAYIGAATSDAVSGALRLGPLPIGDHTITYQGRSVTVPVGAVAADVQKAFDTAAVAVPAPTDAIPAWAALTLYPTVGQSVTNGGYFWSNKAPHTSGAAFTGATNWVQIGPVLGTANGSAPLSAAAATATYVPQTVAQAAELAAKYVFTVQPKTPGAEPFQVLGNSFANSGAGAGTFNHTLHLGFNAARHGDSAGAVTAGKPAIYLGIEDNYFDPVGDLAYGVEAYLGFISPDGTTVAVGDLRPFYTRVTDSTTSTAAKNVITTFDIGSGPNGSWTIWGSIKSGKQLLTLNQTQALLSLPLNVLGSGQYTAVTGNASLLLKANAAGGQATLTMQPNGGAATFQLTADQYGEMYVFDNTNGRIHTNFIRGATSDASLLQVRAVLQLGNTQATTAAAGTAPALPATPQGYFQVQDAGGVVRKVPYFV